MITNITMSVDMYSIYQYRSPGVYLLYRKRGKICWAKHSQSQPYKIFCRNIFVVPWPLEFII